MGDKTNIKWTDATLNATFGCSRVSSGCENCYAELVVAGLPRKFKDTNPKAFSFFSGLTRETPNGPRWTGVVKLHRERLLLPLSWQKPRRIFLNSLSDIFHESLKRYELVEIFGMMAAAHYHTFQVLTKRPERAKELLNDPKFRDEVTWEGSLLAQRQKYKSNPRLGRNGHPGIKWPLPNVWLGVSTEDQKTANERVPLLMQTQAAVRFLSCEPLLGPIDLTSFIESDYSDEVKTQRESTVPNGIKWATGDSRGWDGLEGGEESGEPIRNRLSPGTDNDKWEKNSCTSTSFGMEASAGRDLGRPNDKSQEWKQVRQSDRESRVSDPLGASYSLSSRSEEGKNGSERGEEFNEQVDRPAGGKYSGGVCEGWINATISSDEVRSGISTNISDCSQRKEETTGGSNSGLHIQTDDGAKESKSGNRAIHQVIVGGESGAGFRPMDMAWAQSLRDQCVKYEIAYFFKQDSDRKSGQRSYLAAKDGTLQRWHQYPDDRTPPETLLEV